MNTRRKQFVTPILILGMFAMIFAVLVFTEKTREDGHLPERNGRGYGDLTSFGVATSLAIYLIPIFRAGIGGAKSHPEPPTQLLSMGMRCSPDFIFL
jgi:hypothetical protein